MIPMEGGGCIENLKHKGGLDGGYYRVKKLFMIHDTIRRRGGGYF